MTNTPVSSEAADTDIQPYVTPKREWRKAWRALKQLIATPEDTNQVFIIMRALVKDAFWLDYQRFAKTAFGKRVLDEEIELLDTLTNRKMLAALPVGSFGRTYHDFCQREGISPEGLIDAADGHYDDFTDDRMYRYARRMRESHDLWHILSGYGRDGFGEACVVSFSYAQTKSLGFAAIAVMGAFHFKRAFPKAAVWTAVWQAYRIGKKTTWLPSVNWEALMQLPLEEVREMLHADRPTLYAKGTDVIAGTRPEAIAAL
jgi:ubiquinone biosynthesis protein COQ4